MANTDRLYLSIPRKDIKKLSVGDEVTVKITGKVKALSENDHPICCGPCCGCSEEAEPWHELKIEYEIDSLKVEAENEFTKLGDEEDD